MRYSAVIPNWNGQRLLASLLEDLSAQTVQPEEVLVVDNNSTDGSAQWAEAHGAHVIRLDQNRGFAVAVNSGVAAAGTAAVAILNNDVELTHTWAETVLQAIERDVFATGKILRAGDRNIIDATFDALSCGGTAWRCGNGRPDGPLWSQPRSIQFAPFTALMIHREAFIDAGGLDEAFESYLEDVDFGLRCASKGYTGRYVPEAVAYHIGSATLGVWNPRTVSQIARNQVFILARHYGGGLLTRFGWRIAVAQLLWGGLAARHGTGVAWMRGKLEGIRRFREMRRSEDPGLREVLERSEAEIRTLQQLSGRDLYWRAYFALT